MLSDFVFYIKNIIIGLFYSIPIIFRDVYLILKYRSSYFFSPTTIHYPNCVRNSKYGKSSYVDIETTKGSGMTKTKLRLHYMTKGEENLPTILFAHGFPEFWYSWRYQIEEFSKTHRVLALDMRGYGLSDKPSSVADYQVKHLINDLKGFLEALEIRSVILISHDWGGAISWIFESVYPEMVEKFVACNSPEIETFRNIIKTSWEQFCKSWYIFFFQIPFLPEWNISRFDMKGIVKAFCDSKMALQKEKLSKDDIDSFKANMAQPGALTAGINYYRASFRYPSQNLPTTNNRRIEKNRYMLIFGESDAAISMESIMAIKTLIPNINLQLLPGLSHWVQQDDPVLVNRLIREFIE